LSPPSSLTLLLLARMRVRAVGDGDPRSGVNGSVSASGSAMEVLRALPHLNQLAPPPG